LGSSVFGRLRTPIINYFQQWCGNRLAKSLIRPGTTDYSYNQGLASVLTKILDAYEPDFNEMCKETFSLPTAIGRFEKTGIVTKEDASSIGAVGMVARTSGIKRDIRYSHPHDLYLELGHQPIIKRHGDVYSRAQVRKEEIWQSIGYIRKFLQEIPAENQNRPALNRPGPNMFAISLIEGWRGEICHCAITDDRGELAYYKVKDPSFHNWLALALAVRNNEISDFPICNKSFDLSYCGHDL
jgi:Ni,Fe-hydrogenase III large subunit